jgi:hypothetical protein
LYFIKDWWHFYLKILDMDQRNKVKQLVETKIILQSF